MHSMYGPDSKPDTTPDLTDPAQDHYDMIVEMMREISLQTDRQAMVSVFRKRPLRLYGGDESVSLEHSLFLGSEPQELTAHSATPPWENAGAQQVACDTPSP